jgi:hypothetical protein
LGSLTGESSSTSERWIEPRLLPSARFFAVIAEKAAVAPFPERRHNLRKFSRLSNVRG